VPDPPEATIVAGAPTFTVCVGGAQTSWVTLLVVMVTEHVAVAPPELTVAV